MRASNLRNLCHRRGAPTVIRKCAPLLTRIINPQARSTLVTDILSLSGDNSIGGRELQGSSQRMFDKRLPDALEKCILNTFGEPLKASLSANATINGLTFSTSSKHLGNSSILLQSGNDGHFIPARIDYIANILCKDHDESTAVRYVAARKYQPAVVKYDPFAAFPLVQARLFSQTLDELELYPLSAIDCHFAHLPITWEDQKMVVVISLSRVSKLSNSVFVALTLLVGVVIFGGRG